MKFGISKHPGAVIACLEVNQRDLNLEVLGPQTLHTDFGNKSAVGMTKLYQHRYFFFFLTKLGGVGIVSKPQPGADREENFLSPGRERDVF